MKTNVETLENSQVAITVTLPNAEVEKYRDQVTEAALAQVEVDGFRKGNVPKDMAMKQLIPMKILEEMAHTAISDNYIKIIQDNDIKAIGHPEIVITKIAEGEELEFRLTTAVLPDIKVADYKKIAKKHNKEGEDTIVTDEELDQSIANIRKMRAQQAMVEKQKDLSEDEAAQAEMPSWNDIDDKDLPELDDEWVKTLGDFKDVDDFKEKMKENIKIEKEGKAKDANRMAIMENVVTDSTVDVPEMMVKYELDKMMHEFEHNISMTGTSFDDYLKSIEKTREDYQTEWHDQAKKRAQTQLVLNHIAVAENIDPSDEELKTEVDTIMQQYKDHKDIDENNVKAYVATVLTHQKVFEFLESQK